MNTSDLTAILRDEDNQGWVRFTKPDRVVCVREATAVSAALDELENLGARGYTCIGFVSYEAASAFDASLRTHEPDLPLLLFACFRHSQAWQLAAKAEDSLVLAPELGRPEYAARLARIREHLRAGDSYQVNFTYPLSGFCNGNPEAIFASLYAAQPSSLALYLEWDGLAICSVSPELFFRLEDETIVMQPMKGTRPRATDPEQDRQQRQELLSSAKERAENLMIVDMIRNDLGRIARPGSVTASELFQVQALPTVWQQVSTITARTTAPLSAVFQALFPCASITGAPKAETMAIIHALENRPRGIYTGALGVIGPGRRCRFSVAIRTLTIHRRSQFAEYGVGGGIVWDSEVESEWQETRAKARIVDRTGTGFQLLETMRFEPDRGIERLESHLHRLQRSAHYFGYRLDSEAVKQALTTFNAPGARRLRLLVAADGSFELQDAELPEVSGLIKLVLASAPINHRNRFLRHKTTQRQVYDSMRGDLSGLADDVILWNEQGHITETTIYNLYLEIEGELLTPPESDGLLPGTYRQMLLDKGRVKTRSLSREDLQRAERIFVSNSVRGLCEATLVRLPQNARSESGR